MPTTYSRMRQLTGSTAEWAAHDIVIGAGEIALENIGAGKYKAKIGDGVSVYSVLNYVFENPTGLTTKVTANTKQVALNKAQISDNSAQIGTNTTQIVVTEAQVAINATQIAANKTQIATNKAQVETNTVNLVLTQAQVAENANQVALDKAQVAANKAQLESTALQTVLNTAEINALKSIGTFKGTFPTVADRDNAVTGVLNPKEGDYALIGTGAPYAEWIYTTSWQSAGTSPGLSLDFATSTELVAGTSTVKISAPKSLKDAFTDGTLDWNLHTKGTGQFDGHVGIGVAPYSTAGHMLAVERDYIVGSSQIIVKDTNTADVLVRHDAVANFNSRMASSAVNSANKNHFTATILGPSGPNALVFKVEGPGNLYAKGTGQFEGNVGIGHAPVVNIPLFATAPAPSAGDPTIVAHVPGTTVGDAATLYEGRRGSDVRFSVNGLGDLYAKGTGEFEGNVGIGKAPSATWTTYIYSTDVGNAGILQVADKRAGALPTGKSDSIFRVNISDVSTSKELGNAILVHDGTKGAEIDRFTVKGDGALHSRGTGKIDGILTVGSRIITPSGVAIGRDAGLTAQGLSTVAIGTTAAKDSQKNFAVALGYKAGESNQGEYAIALGTQSGQAHQPDSSIAIGYDSKPVGVGGIHIKTTTSELKCTSNAWTFSGSISGTGVLTPSDERIKENWVDGSHHIDDFDNAQVGSFNYMGEDDHTYQYGFKAQSLPDECIHLTNDVVPEHEDLYYSDVEVPLEDSEDDFDSEEPTTRTERVRNDIPFDDNHRVKAVNLGATLAKVVAHNQLLKTELTDTKAMLAAMEARLSSLESGR